MADDIKSEGPTQEQILAALFAYEQSLYGKRGDMRDRFDAMREALIAAGKSEGGIWIAK